MGVDPASLALIFGGVGSGINAISNATSARGQQRRQSRMDSRAMSFMDEAQTPGFLESILRSHFNTGQDGQMQMLRAMPGGSAIQELSETGNPFDTSELFASLRPIRSRQHSEALRTLQSGAPGLGQRFGSAMMREGANMTERHLQNIAAQDATTALQAHEAAQGRRLQASQLGLGAGSNLLQLLLSAEQGRRGQGLGALQTMAGIPQAGAPQYGQPGVDFGQLMLLQSLMGGGGGSSGTGGGGGNFFPQTRPTFNPPTSLWG